MIHLRNPFGVSLPNTGVSSNNTMMWIALGLVLVGLVLIVVRLKKNNKQK